MKKIFAVFTFFLVFAVILKLPFNISTPIIYQHVNTRVFKTIALYINFSNTFWGISNIIGNTLPFFIWGTLMKLALNLCALPCFFLSSFFIVLFEIAQFVLKKGTCDIDDVILNSVSAFLGIVLVNFLEKRKLD